MIGRRQFVGTTAFALAGVVPAVGIGKEVLQSQPYSDPVLDAIMADFRELRREWDEKPNQRRSVLRATETLTGVLAAHFGNNYDPALKRGLRRQLQRKSREAFIQEMTSKVNTADITHEKMDAAITLLERRGWDGMLRDTQKALRKLRENTAEFQQVKYAQYDYCSDLRWAIQLLTAALAICMGIAALEPTVGGEIVCGALSLYLGILLLQQWWWC